MGFYINRTKDGVGWLPAKDKADALINEGARMLSRAPTEMMDNLVCVVENAAFHAAAYVSDAQELRDFTDPADPRRKTWLIVENAADRSGYTQAG